MEFLREFLGEGSVWPVVISGLFGLLSILLGAKWAKLRKEFKEFGAAVIVLIELVSNMPEKPSAKYLEKVKEAGVIVVKEFKDIIEIFRKQRDGK